MACKTYRLKDWVEYRHFGLAAYRIWHRDNDGIPQQRHEWKSDDGTIRMDDWIRSIPMHARDLPRYERVEEPLPA